MFLAQAPQLIIFTYCATGLRGQRIAKVDRNGKTA
jgi:hypothetical protein